MDPNNISDLAKLFRDHGDRLLNGEIKFTLSGQMLRALNDSFSLIVKTRENVSPSREFIVCPAIPEAKSSVFLDLQLIYDFVQILVHLHISQLITDDELEAAVDLVHFRNLQKIEIHKLPVHKLKGLRRLRNQLEEISCHHCLAQCRDVLRACGGDKCGDQIWSELRTIDFSFNALRRIDDSLRWTPWVQKLNLSHNQLSVESLGPLKYLPNLKYLDLSYNQLEAIPKLAPEASRRLQLLRVKANFIQDIDEVAAFEALVDFDLAENALMTDIALVPLSALASLRTLNLLGNPLAFDRRHRAATIPYLHSNTSTVKFMLNGQPLTNLEKKRTGGCPSFYLLRRTSPSVGPSSSSLTNSTVTNAGEVTRSDLMTSSTTKRRSKVREIILADDHNQLATGSPRSRISAQTQKIFQKLDHLETKKQIEELRKQYGENWLKADGENIVREVFPNSDRQEDIIKRQILMDEINDDSILSSTPKELSDTIRSRISESENVNSTTEDYGTASDTLTGTEQTSTSTAYESAIGKELELEGLEFFQTQVSVEDKPEANEVEYRVEKLNSDKDSAGRKLVVIVSDQSIREKDPETNEVLNRWGLKLVESCERPRGNVISIHFKTMRSNKRQRQYLLEDSQCLKLSQLLRDMLESRGWGELDQSVFKCVNCAMQFCRSKQAVEKVRCPECKGFFVIDITDSIMLKHPDVQKVQALGEERAEKIVKSNSHSSIGSAASLNESSSCSKISNPPAPSSIDSNESVAGSSTSQRDKDADLNSRRLGMESDVEVLSNPSQSSIEVLNVSSKNSSRKHSEERRNIFAGATGPSTRESGAESKASPDAAEHAMEATVAVANKLLGNCQLQVLTESSSSGSITESVCTQYEQAVEEHRPVEEEVEAPQDGAGVGFKKSSSLFLDGFFNASNMLKSLANTSKTTDGVRLSQVDPFVFSTSNFQQTDHRLALYVHQNVFLEPNEKLTAVVRATGFVDDAAKLTAWEDEAIVVLSNRKVYLFFVTGEPDDDDPAQWLRLIKRVDLKDLAAVAALPSAIGVRFSFAAALGGNWNLLLEDGQHTRNYLKWLSDNCLKPVEAGEVGEGHRRKLLEAAAAADGEQFLIVARIKTLLKRDNKNANAVRVVKRGALLVTDGTFAVLADNWRWVAEGRASQGPEVLFQLRFGDMVECECKSGTQIVLNFLDEQENQYELWTVDFDTPGGAQAVLDAIKGPWEKLYAAPLLKAV